MDKPEGLSSQTAVSVSKRIVGAKIAGHAGTLDPLATGLLVICFGRATRACQYLIGNDKRYSALLKIGIETDTCDVTGKTVATSSVKPSLAQMNKVLDDFRGLQQQVPPAFSAIRIDGKRAYNLARKGHEVDVPTREITVHEIAISHADEEEGRFYLDILCSKGTYIRSLCRDIARAAGTYGTMAELRRTSSGNFNLADASTLETMREQVGNNNYSFVLSTDIAFSILPALHASDRAAYLIKNGVDVPENLITPTNEGKRARIYTQSGEFLAVSNLENGYWKCEKSFYEVT